MHSKMIGGVLLVVGTTVGAGMLALPVATAELGFWGSVLLLFISWAIMTSCAFLFLEVNLWMPPNSNLVSMAGATMGRWGKVMAWVVYLFLLYSILSAYIAGGSDLFHYILGTAGINLSQTLSAILFTTLFGSVVYFGIRSVDYVNRTLMFGKMGALILLIILMLPFVTLTNLDSGNFSYITSPASITVTAVAFGCLMIIPSLRTYFGKDLVELRKAVFIGTVIPLICYILWDMVTMGVIPLDGPTGLKTLIHTDTANSGLVVLLTESIKKQTVTSLTKFFTSICIATSFLSVSLSLSDFLSDGFGIAKKGWGAVVIMAGTFLPSLLIVIFYPDAFIRGLEFAGISVAILMIFMPAMMAWRGRYSQHLAYKGYRVPGGKPLLLILMAFSVMTIIVGIQGVI